MTPRENFLNFFRGQPCERIPSSLDTVKILPAMIPENVARGMVSQQAPFDAHNYGGYGFFGIDWRYESAVAGSIDLKPFYEDADELRNWEHDIPFPDYSQFDWARCREENAGFLAENSDKLIGSTIYSGFFERLISFIGFENAAIDMFDEDSQPMICALFSRLADSYITYIELLHRYFRVEFLELHDDWGTQRAPMFSPELHRQMIVPYIKKVTDACHAMGIVYEQHSCGFIEPLIPNLIEAGADTWRGQPVNDKLRLVRKYGNCFRFAVTMQPPAPISDCEALQLARDFRRDYQGQHVWVYLHSILTETQKHLIMDEIYS
jgi:hypothetical protein